MFMKRAVGRDVQVRQFMVAGLFLGNLSLSCWVLGTENYITYIATYGG
jgi:hypothetical protein